MYIHTNIHLYAQYKFELDFALLVLHIYRHFTHTSEKHSKFGRRKKGPQNEQSANISTWLCRPACNIRSSNSESMANKQSATVRIRRSSASNCDRWRETKSVDLLLRQQGRLHTQVAHHECRDCDDLSDTNIYCHRPHVEQQQWPYSWWQQSPRQAKGCLVQESSRQPIGAKLLA